MGTINTSMQAVQKAQIDLGEVDNLPPLGQDMVRCTQTVNMKPTRKEHTHTLYTHHGKISLCCILFIQYNDLRCFLPPSLCIGIQGVDPEQDGRIKTRDSLSGRRHHCRNSLCRQPHSWSVALA